MLCLCGRQQVFVFPWAFVQMHIGADKLDVGSQASVLGWGGAGTPGLLGGSLSLKRIFWLQ